MLNGKLLARACTPPHPEGSDWARTGITVLERIELGGLRHAVLIRGTDLDNPILLFIHGSGVPSMIFAHLEYPETGSPIEEYFTVVHYDQRGFGKTYLGGGHGYRRISIEQYVRDAAELVANLRRRFEQDRIYLLGESWGSIIGAHLAARHPEWFHAFVGAGQVGNASEYLGQAYDYALERAERDRNEKALAQLASPGRPARDMRPGKLFKSVMRLGNWMDHYQLQEHGGSSGAELFFKSLRHAPEYDLIDFQATIMSYVTTQKKTLARMMDVDLAGQVPRVEVPVHFVMGEHDLLNPTSRVYFEALEAPEKHWHVVAGAGHTVRGDDPDAFYDILLGEVLKSRGRAQERSITPTSRPSPSSTSTCSGSALSG